MQSRPNLQPFLEQLWALPFVTDLDFSAEGRRNDREADGILKIRSPKATYRFLVEQKRSYLDRGALNALIAQAKLYAAERREHLLLFARYIPGPSADRLMQSGINFVDLAGNMHLVLGRNYQRTVVGTKQNASGTKQPRISPAIAQLLFAFATEKDAGRWSVRKLADFAGLSKSNVTKLEQQLVDQGVLVDSEDGFRLRDRSKLPEELLRGYELALRPKLLLGRFRAPAREIDEMLVAIRESLAKNSIRWSVTGGAGAYLLQKFYRGLELPIFIESLIREILTLPWHWISMSLRNWSGGFNRTDGFDSPTGSTAGGARRERSWIFILPAEASRGQAGNLARQPVHRESSGIRAWVHGCPVG
jgi:DNA-binding MarR family transcriptional regulator